MTNTLKKAFVWCKRIRCRKGYGIHSPFAFNLITDVIYEKLPYYAYQPLNDIRKSLSATKEMQRLAHRHLKSEKTDELLFRLVNRMQPKVILEVGTSLGLSTLYLSSAGKEARCITLDTLSEENQVACGLLSSDSRIEQITARSASALPQALSQLPIADFIYLTFPYNKKEMLDLCFSKTASGSLLVIEGIYRTKETKELWQTFTADERAGITFDLYDVGLVFFDRTRIKQHYVVNF